MNVIENLQITRPPIDEQRAIARFLDAETLKIDALVAEQRWLIELLTEKRQAVISHAVTKGLNPNAPMKPSGIPWLGDVPKHWEATRLKYICDIWASNIDKKSVDGQQAVLLCNYTDVYYSDEITDGIEFMKATATEDQIERFALRNGDVIITKDSESADDIGVSTYVPATLPGVVCGYHLSMIRPNSNSDGAFIKLLFDTAYVKAKLATLANGLTRYGLGRSAINDLFVPTPPKPEQQVISNYLASVIDKLAALERKAESAIDLLQERRTALISAAVTGKIDVRQHACQETA